jgi:hypothetical protein
VRHPHWPLDEALAGSAGRIAAVRRFGASVTATGFLVG